MVLMVNKYDHDVLKTSCVYGIYFAFMSHFTGLYTRLHGGHGC